ncbi:unnamed protein product [Rotaria socialis]
MSGLKSAAAMPSRRRMAQNYLVIWVDGNIDENNDDCRNTLAQLRSVVSDVNVCTTPEQCVEFLNEIDDGKAFIISSGALGQALVNDIHGIPKVDAIYVFCDNKERDESWSKDWPKIRGVFTSIKPICESLKKVAHECDHDSIPMSFVPKQTATEGATGLDKNNLDRLPPSYMYSIIFKDIILEIDDDDEKSMNTLVKFFRKQNISETEISEFKREYHDKSPVYWYTKPMFLYAVLNRGLRSLDMEAMRKLGFFIRSLHLQLEQLHQEQSASFQTAFTVYRGQGLSKEDFQNLMDSKGGLLSFNNFLSTSKKQKVATSFVQDALERNPDIVGVTFIMTIDPSKISTSITPFAMINKQSALPREQEILFTMHSVFRIVEITQTPSNSRLWEVQLAITDESDPQLADLTDCIKEEVQGTTGWYRMGNLMLKVGHYDQAEELYNELLDNISTDSDRAHVYHQLGVINYHQEDDASLAPTYGNIGLLYKNMGEYSKALEYHSKSLKIYEISLPATHPYLARSYSCIGGVYDDMGEYSKALEYYEKSHKIYEISLPATHPHLATSNSCIGGVYSSMDEYSKALEYYEKSIKIKEISLLPTHPDLATSYNNIGEVYYNMGEYSKALEYHSKSLKIYEISLPATHPYLASSYSCIGGVYDDMGEYSKALEYYEKDLEIAKKALPPTHPNLASSYNNIGGVYNNMDEYSKALEYYEKSIKILEISLPPAHPDLAASYNNIGQVYTSMGEYSKALPVLEKSLDIFRKSLPSAHPHIKNVMNSIAVMKEKL